MRDQEGFDMWANHYDLAVRLSDQENTYPFAGYEKIHNRIFNTIMQKPEAAVLDLGFGTGRLAFRLYQKGCRIYGQDFSERMIELASEIMPNAHLYYGDFSEGLAEGLQDRKFDFIVATYSLHHLEDAQKIQFIKILLEHLNTGGKILIGDLAFQNRAEMALCRQSVGDEWDDEEFYFAADEMKKAFPNLNFEQISFCSGIFSLS